MDPVLPHHHSGSEVEDGVDVGYGLLRIRRASHRRMSSHWFISFPKSGRTWTKTIVENYLCRLHGLPDFTFEEFLPWVRVGSARKIPRIEFMHPYCTETDPAVTDRLMERIAGKKVIVLVRDPREVVFTYYFRLSKRFKDPRVRSMSLSDFIRHPSFGIGRIVDFTNTWYGAGDRFRDFLFLRLEDIKARPEEKIPGLLEFLGIPVNLEVLREVIAATDDRTTRTIEDDSATLSSEDSAFMENACLKLNPAIGYQVAPGEADQD